VGIASTPLITRLKPGKVVVTLPGGEAGFAIGGILSAADRGRAGRHRVRAQDIDGPRCVQPGRSRRIIAHRGEKMDIAEAQQKLAEVSAQLQALERLRKNLKH
jgi:F-type H+-transporting ATPase subunit epsilon